MFTEFRKRGSPSANVLDLCLDWHDEAIYHYIFTCKFGVIFAKKCFCAVKFKCKIFRFWAGPIVIVVAMYAIALWSREKTVVGVENFVSLCGHIFFLVSLSVKLAIACCIVVMGCGV